MIRRLKYGNTNTFYIRGKSGNLLIDTDFAGTLPLFYREIKKHHIQIKDITYLMATHYHPDHIGLVSELMTLGVTLLLMDTQVKSIHFSDRIFHRDRRIKYMPICEENATVIKCEESRAFLHGLGIEGEILSTPSHSIDSVSLILDDGNCFVGDLEPLDYLEAYEDPQLLKEDWKLILKHRPKMIFYAHANEKATLPSLILPD